MKFDGHDFLLGLNAAVIRFTEASKIGEKNEMPATETAMIDSTTNVGKKQQKSKQYEVNAACCCAGKFNNGVHK